MFWRLEQVVAIKQQYSLDFQKILQQSGPVASASYGLLASVLIFTFLGWYIDVYNGSSPKGVLSGLAIGLIVGFYHLLKTVRTHKP